MRVVHPFHPLAGQRLRRVGENANVAGRRVICLDDQGAAWAVPVEWTDLVQPGFEWEISAGRAHVLIDDLLAVAALVAGMRAR